MIPVKRSPFSIVCVLLVAWIASVCGAQTTQPTIIELRGDGATIGAKHGALLGPAIHQLDEGFLGKGLGPARHRAGAEAAMQFESTLRPEHLAEIKALAAATGLGESETMLVNCFLDLTPSVACSTISLPADASPDHVARFARNLDFDSLGIADKYSVVLVYHPTDRYAFVTIGWPGMIGALSGMNEHGLTLANMEVDRSMRPPQAMPYTLLYRTVLERCKNLDEAIALLKATPIQSANNLMVMDGDGNRAVVELTPESVVVRRGQSDAALISTNHQRGQDADTPGKCDRYDFLHDTARKDFGRVDVAELKSMLKHVEQQDLTMQSMIFEPQNRVIYLATGLKAPEREFVKIDLAQYFHP
jgi:predicted choloylglycine hydrolase